jgi:hypothetical protein
MPIGFVAEHTGVGLPLLCMRLLYIVVLALSALARHANRCAGPSGPRPCPAEKAARPGRGRVDKVFPSP